MTKEEAVELINKVRTIQSQNNKQDEIDKSASYNAWVSKKILEIEDDIRNRVNIGISEYEYKFLRASIPENCEEHWYNVPFNVPRCGTSDVMCYFSALGFKCDYRPGRYLSDIITINLI